VSDHSAPPALAGKRVVITRAFPQSSEFIERLTTRRALPISLPLISFAPPEDSSTLDAGLRQFCQFDWVIFTSANAVQSVVARAASLNLDVLGPKSPRVAVVGPATGKEAQTSGFSVDYKAKTHLGVALAQELGDRLRGKKVFLPRSDRANPDLPAALRRFGAVVVEAVAYRTLPAVATDQGRLAEIARGEADAIVFFSPSAVHNFVDLAGPGALAGLQDKLVIFSVGPVTAAALQEAGVHRIVIAADTTAAAVIDALEGHFADMEKRSTPGAKRV
jgi:uroporphyrinogen-III synthase